MSARSLESGLSAYSPGRSWSGRVVAAEDLLLALVLASVVLLPLVEALARKLVGAGIDNCAALVQHLTLVASMLGALVAAREAKLLQLFDVSPLGGARLRSIGSVARNLCAAAVCAFLCAAGFELVSSERAAGTFVVRWLPVWVAQAIVPLGFALIGIRLLWQAGPGTAFLAAALLGLTPIWASRPDLWFYPALAGLGAAALAGAPIFAVLGGLTLALFWNHGAPIASVALDHYRMVVNPTLPAVPLFTLAGFLFAAGGAPARLTRLFRALFGHFRGGVAIGAIGTGAFFTAFTGASGVTILALGGLLLPLLVAARYRERDALGLVTTMGSLGALLPPCLPIILYAIVAQVSIEKMFLGALLPGLLMIALAAWWGARRDFRSVAEITTFDRNEAIEAVRAAKWELALPIVVFASLFGGFATPVEAAALTALYAFIVEAVVHRDLRDWRKLASVFAECGALVGGVLLILGVALALTNYLVDIQLPDKAVAWTTSVIQSKWLFLLALNVLLICVGCVMDIFVAIVVVAPLVVPIGLAFGVDPVHLGVIFLANLELGYLTPPVGVNLFYASSRFKKSIGEVCRSVLPLFPLLAAGVAIITCAPWLSTALPALLR